MMSLDEAYSILAKHHNMNVEIVKNILNKHTEIPSSKKYILPYSGIINSSNCNAIVYNHGLYTQCSNVAIEFCNKCKNNHKYGTINDRKKYELGKYITPLGKKEIEYNIIIKKHNYNIKELEYVFKKNSIPMLYLPEPDISMECETIEVVNVLIDGKMCLRTSNGIILDIESYEILYDNM